MLKLAIFIFFLFVNLQSFSQLKLIENNFQAVTEASLMKMLRAQGAEKGFAIVIETATGKIMAFSGKKFSGQKFVTDSALINTPFEPGGLMTPISLAVLLEDKKIKIDDTIKINNGFERIGNTLVKDNRKNNKSSLSFEQVVATSSNVGIAKAVWNNYQSTPNLFLNSVNTYLLKENLLNDKSKLINYSFGNQFKTFPFAILSFYNGIANNGKRIELSFQPIKTERAFINNNTSGQIKKCLQAVCFGQGTAANSFSDIPLSSLAGKTATTVNIDKSTTVSFIGFFPFDQPLYTCMILIKNKKISPYTYSADVAAPVFKEIVKSYLENK